MKKRILWFVFMTLLIISNVQVYASELYALQVDKQMSKELDIDKVIKRAKNGDISAYEDLSRCYQYGIGVEQSNMNMFIIDMNTLCSICFLYFLNDIVLQCKRL